MAVTRKLGLVVLALVVVAVAVGAAFALGILGAPSVESVDNRFGAVNETTTTIETALVVGNPNPVGASLGGLTIDYAIDMNDVRMANGTKDGLDIDQGTSSVRFSTLMANERIPDWWVSHIRNGEHTDLAVRADVHSASLGKSFSAPAVTRDVDTDIIGAFNSAETRELQANNEPIVQDPVLYLNETAGEWGTVSQAETEIRMAFVIHNPKPYPIHLTEIGYDIGMNDVAVGSGQTSTSYTLAPGETTTVEATTVIDNGNLDEWWVSHLERNQTTQMAIDFYVRIDLSAAGAGTVRIPFDTLTQTIETDFFGTKADDGSGAGAGSGGDAGDGATPTPTATPGDDSSTGTPTASPDESPTPTPTPTQTSTQTPTSTPTPTPSPTPTPTPTPTATTTTDDGGLLG